MKINFFVYNSVETDKNFAWENVSIIPRKGDVINHGETKYRVCKIVWIDKDNISIFVERDCVCEYYGL